MIYKLLHRVPLRKCDVFGVGDAISGVAQGAGSVLAAKEASDAQHEANAINLRTAREANELQDKWFHENQEFNAIQAQMNRDFQSAEAEKARISNQQWNSIGAQAKRAIDFGFNPAVVTGGASGTTVVGASPQGSAASSGSAPNAIAAQVGSPASAIAQALAPLAQIGSAVADIGLKKSQQKKNEADTVSQLTYNDFQKRILEAGIKSTEADTARAYADVKQAMSYCEQIDADIKRIQAVTTLTNNQAAIAEIEKVWKSEEIQAQINKLKSETGWNDQQIEYYKQLLPVQLGMYKSETALNYANASLAQIKKHLTVAEIDQVRGITSLVATQNADALIDYTIKRTYGMKEAKEHYKQSIANTDMLEYSASDVVQILGTTSQVVGAVAGAATSIGAVGAAGKYIRGSKGAASSLSKPATHVPGQNFPYN